MNYTSLTFWALFAVVIALYWRFPHRRQNQLLLVASYVFYGAWDWRFLFLILLSTAIDYIGGLGIAGVRISARERLGLWALLVAASLLVTGGLPTPDFVVPLGTALVAGAYLLLLPRLYEASEERRRRAFLVISLGANLTILGFFKYFDFFLGSAITLGESLGITMHASTLGILLPAGISFYTFQSMSYAIDVYRREAVPTRSFPDFALFVCFFPHLVAGPIMRASTLLPQVVEPRRWTAGAFEQGLLLVLIGLFKKVVIADNLAPMANAVFFRFDDGQSAGITGGDALVALYAFAFQIYGDFSGYSAVARGVSKWMGFELVINFRQPHLATSPSDFWRRWHISLSTWLRDYLYIPLGGNRGSRLATYRNLMITMLLGGLWHGASWTFVAWGLYHGGLLCLFRALGVREEFRVRGVRDAFVAAAMTLLMFHLTCAGWLVFRAETFGGALAMAVRIVSDPTFGPHTATSLGFLLVHVVPLLLLDWATDGEEGLERVPAWPWPAQTAIYASLVLFLVLLRSPESHEFIYFQF